MGGARRRLWRCSGGRSDKWSRDVWRCPPEQEARFGSDANRGVPSWCSRLAGWSRRPGMTGGKLICSATPRRWSAGGGRTRRVHRTGALDRPRKRPGVARERFPFRRGRVGNSPSSTAHPFSCIRLARSRRFTRMLTYESFANSRAKSFSSSDLPLPGPPITTHCFLNVPMVLALIKSWPMRDFSPIAW